VGRAELRITCRSSTRHAHNARQQPEMPIQRVRGLAFLDLRSAALTSCQVGPPSVCVALPHLVGCEHQFGDLPRKRLARRVNREHQTLARFKVCHL
jgi:hypothetical protein